MAFGSGLSEQVGFGAESTFKTAATVDHFYEHDSANLDLNPTWAESKGLRAGGQFKRISRTVMTTRDATGSFKADVTSKKFGLLIRHMLGSPVSVPTLVTGTAYKQVHYAGNAAGLSLTTQIGKALVTGSGPEPFTYVGTKVADYELSCNETQLLKLALTLDAADELTTATSPAGPALTAASYPTPAENWNWTQAAIKIGGTATTTSNVISVSGGVALTTLARGFTLKGTTGLANARYGPNATKSEQIQNLFSVATLTLDCEFNTRSELYDVFRAGTVIPVQITLTGSQIAATGSYNTVDIILPGCKIKDDKIAGAGEGLTVQPINIEAAQDDAGNAPVQVTYISADSTL